MADTPTRTHPDPQQIGGPTFFASLTSLDPLTIGSDVERLLAAGVDGLHVDIADGCFVPFITFGTDIVRSLRRVTDRFLDVHLLAVDPERYFEPLASAGADRISFHVEAAAHPWRTASLLRGLGVAAGLALNPITPVAVLELLGPSVDVVNVQTATHDLSGDEAIAGIEGRIRAVRKTLPGAVRLQVDGGADARNIGRMVAAGADEVVIGRAITRAADWTSAMERIRVAAGDGRSSGGRPQRRSRAS